MKRGTTSRKCGAQRRGKSAFRALGGQCASSGGLTASRPAALPGGGPRPWPRQARLLRRADFQRVYSQGSRYSNPLFVAFALRSGEAVSRIGLTVPRALGKANVRNRIRRRLRETARLRLPELAPGWDIVFNPRRGVLDAPFTRLEAEVAGLFVKLGAGK